MPIDLFDVYFRKIGESNIYFVEDRREHVLWECFLKHFPFLGKEVLYFPLHVIKKQQPYPIYRFYYSTDGEDYYPYFREENRFER